MQCFMLSVIRRHSRVHAVSVGKCTRGTLPSALMRMTTSQTLTRTPETHTRGRLPSATSQTVTRTPEKAVCLLLHSRLLPKHLRPTQEAVCLLLLLLYIPIIPIIYIGYSIIVIFCSNITTSFYKIIHFTTLHYYEVCI